MISITVPCVIITAIFTNLVFFMVVGSNEIPFQSEVVIANNYMRRSVSGNFLIKCARIGLCVPNAVCSEKKILPSHFYCMSINSDYICCEPTRIDMTTDNIFESFFA